MHRWPYVFQGPLVSRSIIIISTINRCHERGLAEEFFPAISLLSAHRVGDIEHSIGIISDRAIIGCTVRYRFRVYGRNRGKTNRSNSFLLFSIFNKKKKINKNRKTVIIPIEKKKKKKKYLLYNWKIIQISFKDHLASSSATSYRPIPSGVPKPSFPIRKPFSFFHSFSRGVSRVHEFHTVESG